MLGACGTIVSLRRHAVRRGELAENTAGSRSCPRRTWALLVVLARRLPPGVLRDLAGFLPAAQTTVRLLRRHPDVPGSAGVAVLVAGWVISPIDLVPEFLPVIGPLDDVVIVALALRLARRVPSAVLLDAWPTDPALMARLIGVPAPGRESAPDEDG
jgi:uncharacterized membrane protein YkvA (DUF1232 family)